MSEAFLIKTLVWHRAVTWENYVVFEAATPFGLYHVRRSTDPEHGDGRWRWGYCFCEYYSEEEFEVRTLREGKAAAEAHWRDRLAGALVAVPTGRDQRSRGGNR